MESRNLIGDQGEQQAVAFLEALGFQILAVNWRYKRFEVDIIALAPTGAGFCGSKDAKK